jgi:hypothetical protein
MIRFKSIASPAGSGMNFAENLLSLAFEEYNVNFIAVGHERKDMEEIKEKQIAILRNPYDTVASGAERWLKASKHNNFLGHYDELLDESDIESIKKYIKAEEQRYYDFFNRIEDLQQVKIISFETLTKNQDLFVETVKEYYGLNHMKTKKATDEEVFDKIKKRKGFNRIPREQASGRTIINQLILEMYPKDKWECWKIYLEIKSKLGESIGI